jgi:hypothetical protein
MERPCVEPSELKHERVKPVSARELRLVLALTVLIAVSANVFAGLVLDRRPANLGYELAKMKWGRLLALQQPVDWLVLGDSSGNQGVDPRVLATHLGGHAINLATIADMTAVNDVWMLDEYLRRFGPPRGVILVHVYDMWGRSILDQMVAEIPLPWGYWRRLEPRLPVGIARSGRLAALRYVPLYSRQDSLLALLRGTADDIFPPFTDDGFMQVRRPSPRRVDADAREHLTFTRQPERIMSDDNRRALAAIGALSDHYGFEVFLASSPLYDRLYGDAVFRHYYDDVGERLRAWTRQSPHRHYVFTEPMLFSRDVMQNADHVTTAGAARYSDALATTIGAIERHDHLSSAIDAE